MSKKKQGSYRSIYTGFLIDPEYIDWTFEQKSFYLSIIILPNTPMAGVTGYDPDLIATYMKLNKNMEKFNKLMQFLVEREKIIIIDNWMFIVNLLKYQSNYNGNDSVIENVKNTIIDTKSDKLIKAFIYYYPEFKDVIEKEYVFKNAPDTPPVRPQDTPDITPAGGAGNIIHNTLSNNTINNNIYSPKTSEKSKPKKEVPYEEIKNLWNEICISHSKVTKLSNTLKAKIKKRWYEFDENIDTWKHAFILVENDEFLSGRNGAWANCNLNWLTKNDENMLRILEGRLKNNPNRGSPSKNDKSDMNKALYEFAKEGG